MSQHVVEQAERQAIHHVLVCDTASGSPRLLLWVFQPLLALALSDGAIWACQLLYQVADSPPPMAHATMPLSLQVCDDLQDTLRRSALIYPSARRKLGPWHVGWLPRTYEATIRA